MRNVYLVTIRNLTSELISKPMFVEVQYIGCSDLNDIINSIKSAVHLKTKYRFDSFEIHTMSFITQYEIPNP
jgi:hypothetical protein